MREWKTDMFEEAEAWKGPLLELEPNAERRVHGRRDALQLAELIFRDGSTVVDVLDVSSKGAQCRTALGALPEDDEVGLSFLDGSKHVGRICWRNGQNFGIEFGSQIVDPEDQVHYDHLGADYFHSIVRLQRLRRMQRP